jgi:hypothetical protein
MGGSTLQQAIQVDCTSGNSQSKEQGTNWGAEWDTLKAVQVTLFPKTPSNRFWPEKYHGAGLQEGMRRRRLTLAPIPEEPPIVFSEIFGGDNGGGGMGGEDDLNQAIREGL